MQLQDTVNIFPDPFTDGVLNIALPHAPVIDGVLIKDQVLELAGNGNINPNIPIIIGTNAAESCTTNSDAESKLTIFLLVIFVHEFLASISEIHNQHLSDLEYDAILAAIFHFDLFHLKGAYLGLFLPYSPCLALYPPNSENDTISMLQLMTDYLFTCPSRRFLALNNNTQASQYLYFFNHSLSFPGWGTSSPKLSILALIKDRTITAKTIHATAPSSRLSSTRSPMWASISLLRSNSCRTQCPLTGRCVASYALIGRSHCTELWQQPVGEPQHRSVGSSDVASVDEQLPEQRAIPHSRDDCA